MVLMKIVVQWLLIAIVFFGDLYFFYLGFKFNSPWMIAMSFLIWPIVGPLGAWCFVFGVPLRFFTLTLILFQLGSESFK